MSRTTQAVPATPSDSLSIQEFSSLFGFPMSAVLAAVETQRQRASARQAFFTIPQLSERWLVSRAQVYAVLRAAAVKVLDMGEGEKRSATRVPADVVDRIEKARTVKM